MHSHLKRTALWCFAFMALVSQQGAAHFLWIVPPGSDRSEFSLVFSEGLQADDPAMLTELRDLRVTLYDAAGETKEVLVTLKEDRLVGKIPEGFQAVALDCEQTWGMFSRGSSEFLLKYRAMMVLDATKLDKVAFKKSGFEGPLVRLVKTADGFTITAVFDDKPLAQETVTIQGPSGGEVALDANGTAVWNPDKAGNYAMRVKASKDSKGQWEDKAYAQVRYYTTLTIHVDESNQASEPKPTASRAFPEIPQTITSFGAVRIEDGLYLYGGHTGKAHSYSNKGQMKELLKLNLKDHSEGWKVVSESTRLQGLAMVGYQSKLIVIGGFTAKNEEGQEHDLNSTDAVSVFDTKTSTWSSLPKLPEPRSSHDAAMIGSTIYVVGGWQLKSPDDSTWHSTAWSMDLKDDSPQWKEIAKPSFERRALAAAEHQGKLYVIGGMNRDGGPTLDVEVYDPKTNQWSDGPTLIGEKPLSGFGAAAISLGSELFVTTMDGKIERLKENAWEVVGDTEQARFFHRLLPINDHQVLAVGGASMEVGKFSEPELIDVR